MTISSYILYIVVQLTGHFLVFIYVTSEIFEASAGWHQQLHQHFTGSPNSMNHPLIGYHILFKPYSNYHAISSRLPIKTPVSFLAQNLYPHFCTMNSITNIKENSAYKQQPMNLNKNSILRYE